jgi:glycosyltransferase involved in cell wall biosynthesis
LKKIFYIAEINLPNKSAYAQHVMKMCDSFASNYKTDLILFSKNKNYNFKNIKEEYLLKNNFNIICYSKKRIESSFFNRIKFSFFCKKVVNCDNNALILSRSFFASFVLSFFRKFNFYEIHNNLTSISGIFFKLKYFFIKETSIYFILIHKNLKKILKIYKQYITLDDGVELNYFKFTRMSRSYDCVYIGSLYSGKGLEIILYLANHLKNIKFHIFGDIKTLYDKSIFERKINNLIFHDHIPYKKVPYILTNSKILLMPYLNKVNVKSQNIEVSRFMSPLKLFDYLAAGRAIIASNLPVYNHILKHEKNCLLADPKNYDDWINKIQFLNKNKKFYNKISNNAYNTAKKFTWFNRTKKIIELYKNNFK